MRNWLILSLLILAIGITSEQTNAFQEPDIQAIIRPNVLEFIFPIPNKDTFEWYQDNTPDNDLEYAWQIRLEGTEKRSDYEFGVYLFKYPGSKPAKGNFTKLISRAQVSIWDQNGNQNKEMKISALVENSRLIIRVTDKRTIGALMANHPKTVYFTVRAPDYFATKRMLLDNK
ncbi:MAG: hypothetical protein WCA04_07810 [Geobacteraceae bacterium]